MKYLVLIAIVSLFLVGCSSLKEKRLDNLPNEIFMTSQLQDGNWKQAIKQLEIMSNNYPFGSCSQKIQLNLIYAYYKNSDLLLAQASIDRFIRLNPTHPNIDYVIYMRGLTNMALDNNVLQDFFGVDRFDRDPQHAHDAFNDFFSLIHNFPKSQYVTDAKNYLIFLRDRLAKYEYSIANYYTHRSAWVAVINRIEGMLKNYPNSKATKDGLNLMKNAYCQMQMVAQANKVSKIILSSNN